MPNKAAARCDAQRCLYCFLHTFLLKASLSAFVGLHGAQRYSPLPLSPPYPLSSAFCFCADEIKDDFDTLGPDATLQAVGNGTGESTEDVFLGVVVRRLSPCHALTHSVPISPACDLSKRSNVCLQHLVTGCSSLQF